MNEESIYYFKQKINNGIRYGSYNLDEMFKDSILIDVYEIYLDFKSGHYTFTSQIVKFFPLFDDLIEISADEYYNVKKLYNDYNILNSQFDEEFTKLNYVH